MKLLNKRIQKIRRSLYLRVRGAVMSIIPASTVENQSEEDVYVIINTTSEDYEQNQHSIRLLPAGQNSIEAGIPTPEGIVLGKNLYLDSAGEVRVEQYTPIIKTSASSCILVEDPLVTQPLTAQFSSKPIGLRGKIIFLVGIKPSLKAAKDFSEGRFVRPKDGSPLQLDFDRMVAFFPPWDESNPTPPKQDTESI